ncbi:hypothetical protein COE18_14650 [Bacillus cereus]|uniref:Uncharacterized protein n=1 Tax=Bacillus cereus TaxID=1396 RepID=A0A9X6Z8A4_BACCE|nr:hypothetical protein CN284_05010 [Bacillus cereus]PFD20278.1 hypothetical protein CN263_18550 [Bacillus cereus]PGW61728.1 hypothetical protein COE18_14650 [Bacillus cereus]
MVLRLLRKCHIVSICLKDESLIVKIIRKLIKIGMIIRLQKYIEENEEAGQFFSTMDVIIT